MSALEWIALIVLPGIFFVLMLVRWWMWERVFRKWDREDREQI